MKHDMELFLKCAWCICSFLTLFPDFSPRAPRFSRTYEYKTGLESSKNVSEIYFVTSLIRSNHAFLYKQSYSESDKPVLVYNGFANAFYNKKYTKRKFRQQKDRHGKRWSAKRKLRNGRRLLPLHQQKPTRDTVKRTFTEEQTKIETNQRKLRQVLNELDFYEEHENHENCATRYERNPVTEYNAKFQPHKVYGTLVDSTLPIDSRNRRHVSGSINADQPPSVVYFSGNTLLQRNGIDLRSDHFTAELWVKPEGGQKDPTVILASSRIIDEDQNENVWNLGIKSNNQKTVFYFSMTKDDTTLTVFSPYSYKPEEWTHLAVSSGRDGVIRLYVNGVQVGVGHDPGSFELSRQGVQCDTLLLGGNEKLTQGYRGMIDQLKIFSQVLPQQDIRKDMYNFGTSDSIEFLQINDDFDIFRSRWSSIGSKDPFILHEDTPSEDHLRHFPEVRAPPCGQTVCDNPEVVRSYVENWSLRKPKTLRYNIVNINEDDGSNPMFTYDDVELQSTVLRDVFGRHNITWMPTLVHINNSKLRRKTIGCEPAKIGNRQCNIECMHVRLGFDGGDCDLVESTCNPSNKGNGHCDPECNKVYHDWDLGDCCNPGLTNVDDTCFDPKSQNRGYLSITEYKTQVGADNAKQLNVLFANWTNPNSIGISTFPWDKEVFTSQGGTVVQLKRYTTREEMSGLVHELGHNLGLLHVHHGSHNVDCDDSCAELRASMTTGDLCEDTNPTPMNMHCGEPNGTQAVCSIHNFTRTPYSNFMSYADGSCQDNFTPQQRARMHCYIDLMYGQWTVGEVLPPIPLPPKVVATSTPDRSAVISWAPPIDGKLVGNDRMCDLKCTSDKRLRQYASNARSQGETTTTIHRRWSAQQATGPPDQESCALRGMHFWMPPDSDSLEEECGERCSLDLSFEESVVPSMLRIWVTFGTEDGDGIKSIAVFHHEDNTVTTISGFSATCDTPSSVHLQMSKATRRIRINVNYPYTAIDAVELISQENNKLCSGCRRIKYKIHRNPPFPNDIAMTTEQLQFVDKSCEDEVTYSYSIQPFLHPHHGGISPSVVFRHGKTFCGDGIIQESNSNGELEECDDGNIENEDGCNSSCYIEQGFYCAGHPSLCYWHDGDGICEDFERSTNSPECRVVPTTSYAQQWVVDATSSSAALEALYSFSEEEICPSSREVTGIPDSECGSEVGVWSPCMKSGMTDEVEGHWMKVVYLKPVIPLSVTIYTSPKHDESLQEEFILLLPNGEEISSGTITTSCVHTNVFIPIPENSHRPKINSFIMKFDSDKTAIDAVSLNSRKDDELAVQLPIQIPASTECRLDLNFVNFNVTCHTEAGLSVDVTDGNTLPNQTVCDVVCNPGHLPKFVQRVTCRNGAWDSGVKCIPISCGPPSHVRYASFSCQSGHKLNAVCNFTCWKHARLFGSDNTFRCAEDGTWSTPSAYCEPMCGAPPNIGFATASCDALSKRASRPGESCKYRCKNGYHVTQQPMLKRTFRLTCGSDGIWKGPGCQPALCPTLPQIYKGLYKCTRGFVYGSVCSMSCNPNDSELTTVIRCDSNGQWNASFPMCPNINTTCQLPISSPGVEVLCDGYSTGQTCRASCIRRFDQPSFDIVATTDKVGLSEFNRKTRILVCLGDKWFPQPDQLYCIFECDSKSIGNRWCDKSNNREYCGWDGGDCCASTMKGKRTTCANECDCIDPNAEENNPLNKKNFRTRVEIDVKNRFPLLASTGVGSTKIKTRESKIRNSLADRDSVSVDGTRRKRKNRRRDKLESGSYFDVRAARRKYRSKNRSRRLGATSRKLRRERRRSRSRKG